MAKAKATEARVLLNHGGFKADSIVTGDNAALGISEGWADGDPAAVAYAKTLGVENEPAAEESKAE